MSQRLQRRVVCSLLASFALAPAFAQDRRPVDTPPQSRVFGRVLDTDGKPLAGVIARLRSVDGPWADGVVVPLIRLRGYEMQGFEVATRNDGRFEVSVPTPTADWISLDLEPDRYHDIDGREFGPAGGRDQPRLVAGNNDLGEFRLAATGVIAGRVLDERGRPIAGAVARLDDSLSGGRIRSGSSDATGAFAIEHVPAGNYGVEVLRDGFIKLELRAAVAVRVNETSNAGDFVLRIAPTISGFVLDELAQPVANAWVWGWPDKGGTGAGARSDAQGRFVVALKQVDAHYFEVEVDGFAKLDEGRPWDQTTHSVGANDVRLVLNRPRLTTFVALDAATGNPVERYSLEINFREYTAPNGTTTHIGEKFEYGLANHAGGEFACEADPLRHGFVIRAPGYERASGLVTHESPASARCVAKLRSGSAISGRATLRGEPAQRAKLWLYDDCLAEQFESGDLSSADEVEVFGCGEFDPYWLTQPRAKSQLGSSGRFVIESLPPGDYRLVIETPGGDRIALDPLEVGPGASTDLGDVALDPACRIEGRVLLRDGVSTSGWRVSTSYLFHSRAAELDADGRFVLEGLQPTLHRLCVESPGSSRRQIAHHEQRIAPAETARIELDARGVGALLELDLRIRGAPAQGVTVALTPLTQVGAACELGPSDAAGRLRDWSTVIGVASAEFSSELGLPLGRALIENALRPGAFESRTVELSAAHLTIEWPAEERWRWLTRIELSGTGLEPATRPFRVSLDLAGKSRDLARVAADAPRCDFSHLAPGRYEMMLRLFSNTGRVADYRRTVDVPDAPEFVCRFTAEDSR